MADRRLPGLRGDWPSGDARYLPESALVQMLRERHTSLRYGTHRWAFADHVPDRPSGAAWGGRICDFLAVDCYNGIGPAELTHPAHGFEIKSTRKDWLAELRDPAKAEAFKRYCDHWWLVVPDQRILGEGELPQDWGLLVVAGDKLRAVHRAPRLPSAEPWPRALIASFARAVARSARASEDVRNVIPAEHTEAPGL